MEKKWDVEISAGGGARSVYYRDRDWFGVAALSLSAHWKPLSIFRLGGGVDVFYDGAYAAVCDEFADFIRALKADIPELADVTLGVSCSDELYMADACAIAAIIEGVGDGSRQSHFRLSPRHLSLRPR